VCRIAIISVPAVGALIGIGLYEELVLKDVGWECDKQRSFLRY
jgi:hypothetical protein